jgi:hypothetical protein
MNFFKKYSQQPSPTSKRKERRREKKEYFERGLLRKKEGEGERERERERERDCARSFIESINEVFSAYSLIHAHNEQRKR